MLHEESALRRTLRPAGDQSGVVVFLAPAAELESARGNRGQGREPIYGQQSQEANEAAPHFDAYPDLNVYVRVCQGGLTKNPPFSGAYHPMCADPALGLWVEMCVDCRRLWGNKHRAESRRCRLGYFGS